MRDLVQIGKDRTIDTDNRRFYNIRMKREEFIIKKLEILLNIQILKWNESESQWDENSGAIGESPFWRDELRKTLLKSVKKQKLPVIMQDENKVVFCCVQKSEDEFYFVGPICVEVLSHVEIHRYYKKYGMSIANEQHPPKLSIYKLLTAIELLCYELIGESYEDEELIYCNNFVKEATEKKDEIVLDEEKEYHHTYSEEVKVMDYIREGNLNEIVSASDKLLCNAGKLSKNKFSHEKYIGVCSITISARAAIDGGVHPSKAYQLSDVYINKIDKSRNIMEVFELRKEAMYEFTKLVVEEGKSKASSNYVEQCKMYINQKYNSKIYISDIAEALGLSEKYLSKVFKKEIGKTIQEYILEYRVDRAANLLKYSEASILEISDYIGFYSQSHFGKVFKQYKHMTPKEYRDKNQRKEFTN